MDIRQIRLYNLELALTFIERKDLAEKLDYQTNYINQFLSKKNPKNIADKFARDFESKFNLVHGWFDTKRSVYDFQILFGTKANATKVDVIAEKYDVKDFSDQRKMNIVPIEGTIEIMTNEADSVVLNKTVLKKGVYAPNAKVNTVAFIVKGGELPKPYKNNWIVLANENELPAHGEDIILKKDDTWYICEFLFQSEDAYEVENYRTGKRMTIPKTQVEKFYHVVGNFPASQIIELNK